MGCNRLLNTNGLIEQWGTVLTDSSGGLTFNLLIHFSNTNYITIPTMGYSGDPDPVGYNKDTKTTSSIRLGIDTSAGSGVPIQYKMIGY